MNKYKIVLIILLMLFAGFSTAILADTVELDNLNVYKTTSWDDTSLLYIIPGSTFYLKGETSTPPIPTIPPRYIIVECTRSENVNDTVFIKLYQEASDSFVFRSDVITIVEEGLSNSQLRYIGVKSNSGETVTFSYRGQSDSLNVAIAKPPIMLNNLKFFSNSLYSDILSGSVPLGTPLFIQANGLDGNEHSVDTFAIVVEGKYDSILIPLIETEKNSGIYRNNIEVKHFSNINLRYIKALENGDTIFIYPYDLTLGDTTSVLYVQESTTPEVFNNINFKTSNTYDIIKIDDAMENELLYIKLYAEDKNINTLDNTIIVLENITTGDSVSKEVYESSSGIYTFSFQLGNNTNKTSKILGVSFGDEIRVYAKDDGAIFDTIIVATPQIPEFIDNLRLFFDDNYSNIIQDTIPPGTAIYIEANGQDANSKTIDTVSINVVGNGADTIVLNLIETGRNTGIYRSIVKIENYTDTNLRAIKGFPGDEIFIGIRIEGAMTAINHTATVNIQAPTKPGQIINLELKSSSAYTATINDSLVPGDLIYIEMIAEDNNPLTMDYSVATVKNNTNGDSIQILLNEIQSGVFRGIALLSDYTSEESDKLKVSFGDTVSLLSESGDTVSDIYYTVTTPQSPSNINNIRFMNASFTEAWGDSVLPNSTLYVEANGLDANSLTEDTMQITVQTTHSSINLILTETGRNTGKYRGTFSISNYTAEAYNIIEAYTKGDTIVINSNSFSDTVRVDYSISPEIIYNLDVYRAGNISAVESNILPAEQLRVIVAAQDLNPLGPDQTTAIITNNRTGDSITITLNETGNATGLFEGTFKTAWTWTNLAQNEIGVIFNDSIAVVSVKNSTVGDTIYVTAPIEPTNIHSVKFMSQDFSTELPSSVQTGKEVGIRVLAEDNNPIYPDTILVTLQNNESETIELELLETAANSGEFRNTFFIDNYTFESHKKIKAFNLNDTVIVNAGSKTDLLTIIKSSEITDVQQINTMSSGNYLFHKEGDYRDEETVYLEVIAPNASPYIEDYIILKVISSSTPTDRINIRLNETDINTSRFRGTFKLTGLTNDTLDEIKANYGDTITISTQDESDSIYITMTVPAAADYINSLKVYSNSSYADELTGNVALGTTLYIEVNGEDGNFLTVDTLPVVVEGVYGSIDLTLTETGRNTGRYRNNLQIKHFNSSELRYIKAVEDGDTVHIRINTAIEGSSDTYVNLTVRESISPAVFYDMKFKSTSSFQNNKTDEAMENELLYVELTAEDANIQTQDMAIIVLMNNVTGDSVSKEVFETSSGIYRTTFQLANNTNKTAQILGVNFGDTILVFPASDNTTNDTLIITTPKLPVFIDNLRLFFDANYSNIIYDTIPPGTFIYIEANGQDGNSKTIDTVALNVVGNGADTIVLNLVETARNTGIYRGIVKIENYTDTNLRAIKGFPGDEIFIGIRIEGAMTAINHTATVNIQAPTKPGQIINLELKSSSAYTATISDSLVPGDLIYIEMIAEDNNPLTMDYSVVTVKNNTNGDSIKVLLSEVQSGVFRGMALLSDYTSEETDKLKTNYGDSISLMNETGDTVSDVFYAVTTPQSPSNINNIRFMNASFTEACGDSVLPNSTLYVEANGLDANNLTVDTFSIKVISTYDTINLVLTETGKNIGKYQGIFSISNYTSESYKIIKAISKGDTIIISWTSPFDTTDIKSDIVRIDYSVTPSIIYNLDVYKINGDKAEEVLTSEELRVVVSAEDLNPLSPDRTTATITNNRTGDSITILLNETGNATGIFAGNFKTASKWTNQTLSEIGVIFSDSISVVSTDSNIGETIFITTPASPENVHSVKFMRPDFTSELPAYTKPLVEIGVRILAEDINPIHQDTVSVQIYDAYGDYIILELLETSVNSGEFRNTFFLDNYTYQNLLKVNAHQMGDTVVAIYAGTNKSDTLNIITSMSPDTMIKINLKSDGSYLYDKIFEYTDNDIVYIEVIATDLNPYIADELIAVAYSFSGSETTSYDRINIILKETDVNSSRFRGTFRITDLSNDTLDELEVNWGDTIRVEVPNIYASNYGDTFINWMMTIPQKPLSYNQLLFTLSNYQDRWPSYMQVNYGDNLYIKFTGTDANPLTVDTVAVNLYTLDHPPIDTSTYLFTLELTETGRNTGIYNGSVLLDTIKVPAQNRMRTRQNTFIVMNTVDTFPSHNDTSYINNAQDTVQTATARPPTSFISLDLKTDASFNYNKLSPIIWDEFLYIEAEADKTTSSNLVVDTIAFEIWSDYEITRDPPALNNVFYLFETDIHSGIYRNSSIEVKNVRDVTLLSERRLETQEEEWVTIILLHPEVDTIPTDIVTSWAIDTRLAFSGSRASNSGLRFDDSDFGFAGEQAVQIFQREVAYQIPPDRLRDIVVYRDQNYSIGSQVANFISFEPPYNRFYFEATAFDLDGDIFDTRPYSNHMLRDEIDLYIEVRRKEDNLISDSNYITVLETLPHSNKYRNWINNPTHWESMTLVRPGDVVSPQNQIWGRRGDNVFIYGLVSGDSAPIGLTIEEFKSPDDLRSLNFFTNSNYNAELAGINLIMEDFMYIQAVGRNSAQILIDTVVVKIIRESNRIPGETDYITVRLTETAVGSEIYRVMAPDPLPRIYYFTDNAAKYIYAEPMDTITVVPYYGAYITDTPPELIPTDATRIGTPQSPTHIFVFSVFTNPGYTTAVVDSGVVALDGTLYLEARGDIGNNVIMDTTLVIVENVTTGELIRKTLKEMGPADGRYRGEVRLMPTTNDTLDELGVNLGDKIRLRVFQDQYYDSFPHHGDDTQYVNVTVPQGYPKVIFITENTPPTTINNINFMNAEFNQTISQLGGLVRNRSDIYIEVNGLDGNSELADYIYVMIYSLPPDITPVYFNYKDSPVVPLADSTTITYGIKNVNPYNDGILRLKLTETDRNTGKFQGVASLRDYNDTHQKFISARQGHKLYSVVRNPVTKELNTNQVRVASFETLTYITFLSFRTPDYQDDWQYPNATFGDEMYIMLFGDIGSPLLVDEVDVVVYNVRAGDTYASDSVIVTLTETGEQTGEYRGRINMGRSPTDVTRHDASPQVIQIDDGDTLYLKWYSENASDSYIPWSTTTAMDSIVIAGELSPQPPTDLLTLRITTDNTYIHAVDTMTTTILPTDYVWVEVIGRDESPWTIDPTEVIAFNPTYGESIVVTLWESSRASGEFQGYFKLDNATNQSMQTLKASLGQTIIVWSLIEPDTEIKWTTRWQVHTVQNRPPETVNSISFMKSDYSDFYVGSIMPLSELYVQLDGKDGEPLWRDTTYVYVSSNKDTVGIKLLVTETGINTGKYRGNFGLQTYSEPILKLINAYEIGDTVIVSETEPGIYGIDWDHQGWFAVGSDWIYVTPATAPPGAPHYRYDIVNVDVSKSPENIVAVRIKDSANYLYDRIGEVGLDDILYIEVIAEDRNPLSVDTTIVNVVSTKKNNYFEEILNRISVVLTESGPNTSRFRGTVHIKDLTNDTLDELGVNFGDTITVFSATDTSVKVTIKVGVLYPPETMNQLIFMNSSYSQPFMKHEQVQFGDELFIQFTGNDASPHTVDTVAVLLTSLGGETTADGRGRNQLIVTLYETDKNTGVYRNSIILSQTKVQLEHQYRLNTLLNGWIFLEPYDTGYWEVPEISYNEIVADTIQTATMMTPKYIFDINLMEPGWNQRKLSPIKWGEPLHIEAEADKWTSSNLLHDTVALTFISTTESKHNEKNDTLVLWETAIHSGIFRATIEVNHIDDVGAIFHQQMLEVDHGDTVFFKSTDPEGVELIWNVADFITPPRIKTLNLYRDANYSKRVSDNYISYESAYRNLYFWAEAWALPGHLEFDTWPYANSKLPDTFTLVLQSKSDTLYIEMIETGDHTRIYKNKFDVPSVTISEAGPLFIRALRGDTVLAYADVTGSYPGDTQPFVMTVQENRQPSEILDLKFYTNSSYSQQLQGLNLNIEDRLYIQAVGRGSASILKDTITVVLRSSSSLNDPSGDTQIEVLLTETEVGSEIYRVFSPEIIPQLFYRTLDENNYLLANTGDKIELFFKNERTDTIVGPADVTYVAQPQSPDRTYTINAFTDAGYNHSTLNKEVARVSDLYIEVRGEVGNNILRDTTMVGIHNINSNDTIYIELLETGPADGVYRGSAKLGLVSNITLKTLGVNYGDTIVITSFAVTQTAPPVTLNVAKTRDPARINTIRFYNSNYTQLLSEFQRSRVLNQTKLYIELNGEDATPLVQDLTSEEFIKIYSYPPQYEIISDGTLMVKNTQTNDSYPIDSAEAKNWAVGQIPVRLLETDLNTGQYQGEVNLSTVNDTYKILLKADTAYIITAWVWCEKENRIYYDTAMVADFEQPRYITSMRFMDPNYITELQREVTFDEILYIEMFGDYASPLLRDEPEVEVLNLSLPDTHTDAKVVVKLKETTNTSGFFRGQVMLSEFMTNQDRTPPLLKVASGDNVMIQWKHRPQSDTSVVTVASPVPRPPKNISHLNIFKTLQYITPYEKKNLTKNITMYIEAIEADTWSNPVIVDTMTVYVYNQRSDETITVMLTETSLNSRTFRGIGYLTETQTNETQNRIRADFSDTIILIPYLRDAPTYYQNSQIDSAVYNLLSLKPPVSVNSLRFMEPNWEQRLVFDPIFGDLLYIQLDGLDDNPNYVDKFNIKIHSFYDNGFEYIIRTEPFDLELEETEQNSGIYKALVQIDRVTFRTHVPPKIRAEANDYVVISYEDRTNRIYSDTVHIRKTLEANDVQDLTFIFPGTNQSILFDEFDYGIIGVEGIAPSVSPRTIDNIKLRISKIDKTTGDDTDVKELILHQQTATSISFRNSLNIVPQYTLFPADDSPMEIQLNRGDTLVVQWNPPADAPAWADTITLRKKIGEYNQPDTIGLKIYKKIGDELKPMSNFDNIINQNDIIVLIANELAGSVSNPWVVDTVGIDVGIIHEDINKVSAYNNSINYVINNQRQSFTLTETSRNSKEYRAEILVTNDPETISDYFILYGISPGSKVVFMIEDNIEGVAVELLGGRFLSQNPENSGPYPNPYHIKESNVRHITFAGMKQESNVKIYDPQGRLVITLYEAESPIIQGYAWDMKNSSGKSVVSGVYIYVMTTLEGQVKVGKFSIIR